MSLLLLAPAIAASQTPHTRIADAMLEVSWAEFDKTRAPRSICLPRENARITMLGHPLMVTESVSDSGPNAPQRECLSPVVIPQIILCVPLTVLVELGVGFLFFYDRSASRIIVYLTELGAVTTTSGPAVWGVGRIFGGKGSFFKTTVGTAVGALICICAAESLGELEGDVPSEAAVAIFGGIPVLGGIVGFNLR